MEIVRLRPQKIYGAAIGRLINWPQLDCPILPRAAIGKLPLSLMKHLLHKLEFLLNPIYFS